MRNWDRKKDLVDLLCISQSTCFTYMLAFTSRSHSGLPQGAGDGDTPLRAPLRHVHVTPVIRRCHGHEARHVIIPFRRKQIALFATRIIPSSQVLPSRTPPEMLTQHQGVTQFLYHSLFQNLDDNATDTILDRDNGNRNLPPYKILITPLYTAYAISRGASRAMKISSLTATILWT